MTPLAVCSVEYVYTYAESQLRGFLPGFVPYCCCTEVKADGVRIKWNPIVLE